MKQLLVLATALATFPVACADSDDETSSNDLGVIGSDDSLGKDAGESDDAEDSGAADHADGSSGHDTDDGDVSDDSSSEDDTDVSDDVSDDGSSEDDDMGDGDDASGPTDLDDIQSGDDIALDDSNQTDGGRGVLDAGTTTGGQDSGGARADGGTSGMATAITRAQLDLLRDNGDDGSSDDGFDGDNGLDPNDLFLRVASLGSSCDESFAALECGGHWALSIALPPQAQAVGVYDLEDAGISRYSGKSETSELQSDDPDDCAWGDGSIGPGTIEVLAIDDEQVRFRVQLEPLAWGGNPNGEYIALRCQ